MKNFKVTSFEEKNDAIYNLEYIIGHMPGYIYWKDKNSIYRGCNDNLAILSGLKNPREIFGKSDFDFEWGKNDAEKFIADDKKVMASGQIQVAEYELPIKRADGRNLFVRTDKMPLYNQNGEVVGVLAIAVDITEQKKTEAALKVAQEYESEIRRAVMILTASMAHDLRNPLIISRMTVKSMQKYFSILVDRYKHGKLANLSEIEELTDFQIEYLAKAPEKLLESFEQMNTIIDDDLKTISHVIGGSKSRDDLIACRINSCITKAMSYYPFEAGEKELVSWQSGSDFVFAGNPVLFYRVIFNLLKNALYQVKKHKRGRIFIAAERSETINILRFKDTAGGVTNEIVSKLFESFSTTKKEGTGIGLAFSQFTMHSFCGDISAHCVDGDCIEFVLSFPQ